MNTTARDSLYAFHAAHPDIQNADGEQFLELPTALLDEHDALLAAACREKTATAPIAIDPVTAPKGSAMPKTTTPTIGRIAIVQHASQSYMPVLAGTVTAIRNNGKFLDLEGGDLPGGKITAIRNWGAHYKPVYWWEGHILSF